MYVLRLLRSLLLKCCCLLGVFNRIFMLPENSKPNKDNTLARLKSLCAKVSPTNSCLSCNSLAVIDTLTFERDEARRKFCGSHAYHIRSTKEEVAKAQGWLDLYAVAAKTKD